MDITTIIYQHAMAALLATSGASAVIGWLARHWTVIGRVWNGVVTLAGWVRKLGPAPAAPSDLESLLKETDPKEIIALFQALKDVLPKDLIDKLGQSDSTSQATVHSNLP